MEKKFICLFVSLLVQHLIPNKYPKLFERDIYRPTKMCWVAGYFTDTYQFDKKTHRFTIKFVYHKKC